MLKCNKALRTPLSFSLSLRSSCLLSSSPRSTSTQPTKDTDRSTRAWMISCPRLANSMAASLLITDSRDKSRSNEKDVWVKGDSVMGIVAMFRDMLGNCFFFFVCLFVFIYAHFSLSLSISISDLLHTISHRLNIHPSVRSFVFLFRSSSDLLRTPVKFLSLNVMQYYALLRRYFKDYNNVTLKNPFKWKKSLLPSFYPHKYNPHFHHHLNYPTFFQKSNLLPPPASTSASNRTLRTFKKSSRKIQSNMVKERLPSSVKGKKAEPTHQSNLIL